VVERLNKQAASKMGETGVQVGGNQRSDTDIDCLIMLDRSIDLVSPFVMQNTYEGLLDETFGIECGAMTVKRTIMTPDTEETKKMTNLREEVTVKLSNEDSLYKSIRDGTLPMLGDKTKELLAALKRLQDSTKTGE